MSYDTAKNKLECFHVLGSNRKRYFMPCDILKTMNDGRLKLKVYGDRYWSHSKDKTAIRYVQSCRVSAIT